MLSSSYIAAQIIGTNSCQEENKLLSFLVRAEAADQTVNNNFVVINFLVKLMLLN